MNFVLLRDDVMDAALVLRHIHNSGRWLYVSHSHSH